MTLIKLGSTQSPPIFCKDCAHFTHSVAAKFATCASSETEEINLVYGLQPVFCEQARQPEAKCGIDALLFVPAVNSAGDAT